MPYNLFIKGSLHQLIFLSEMVGVLSYTMKAFNGLRICIEAHRNSIFHRLCALHLPLTSHLILIYQCDCISNEHSPSCEKTVFLSPNSRHNRISTWTFVSMTFPLILHFPPTPWKIIFEEFFIFSEFPGFCFLAKPLHFSQNFRFPMFQPSKDEMIPLL